MADDCYHCGRPVPEGVAEAVTIAGSARPMCCAGCAAAASLIVAQGLARYYDFRSAGAIPGGAAGARDWSIFDRDAALRRYTHLRDDGRRDATLAVDGMHCAACGWLVENSLRQLAGVSEIHVNPGGARAELVYDPATVSFGRVLAGVHALGYLPRPVSYTAGEPGWRAERDTALKRLAVAGLGMMQVMTYAVGLYAGAMEGIDDAMAGLLRFVSLLVTTPVVLYAAQPFFAGAWRSLRARTLGMDVPVALGIGGAYLWSVWATLSGDGDVYFDSAVMFTFFLLLGRFIEMSLRHRSSRHSDALARLLPDSVLRLDGERTERVTPEELDAGDLVRILPGERVPADGTISSGRTEVDESLLTGESLPRLRESGDALIAGTMNLTGAVELRVARVGQDSTLAAVSRLLERAQASRPHVAELADRAAAWFVAAVLAVALLVGLYWSYADPARAVAIVLAVLVVTCPCALSLATPAALAAATTRLARAGLLVARGRAIERLARADRIVLDKTGTLTRGLLRIDAVELLDARVEAARCLAVAAALERYSEHPIARAFAAITPAANVEAVTVAPGWGVEGRLGGHRYRIGRRAYVLAAAPNAAPCAAAAQEDARPAVFLGDQGGLVAAFILSDALRSDAPSALADLRALGLEAHIASGDRPAVVTAVAARLGGIDARAGASSADKLAFVRELQRDGHVVAVVGDGVNDAPVLAGGDVSIAIGSGTDLAKVSADLVMPGEELAPIAAGVRIARRTLDIIRQNLAWAIMYNAFAVPLAATGQLTPWVAAIGMSASSLLVVLNAMRLLGAARAPHAIEAAPAAPHASRA